jgi:hypothetical protein
VVPGLRIGHRREHLGLPRLEVWPY